MKTLEKVVPLEKIKIKQTSFQIIILKVKSTKNSFDGKILGRSLFDWVAFACNGNKIKMYDFDGDNVLQFVKEKVDISFDYSVVLFSNTPLLDCEDIKNIKEYATYKQVDLCKLPSGYIVNNKKLTTIDNLQIDSVYSQNIDNFYIVENKKQFTFALKVLQNRINDFHIENGVEMLKPESVYIEPEVDIESGVIIYPNNSIKGSSKIYSNVILKDNNVIENSKIGIGSCCSGSVISNSVIGENVYISQFSTINNGLIGEGSVIGSNCVINNYNIDMNSKIKSFTILGEENDSDSGAR